MPRTIFEKKSKYDKLLVLIRGNIDVSKKSQKEIAAMIDCHENTLLARFRHPEEFKIDELLRIGRGLNIPIEEIRQCIQY